NAGVANINAVQLERRRHGEIVDHIRRPARIQQVRRYVEVIHEAEEDRLRLAGIRAGGDRAPDDRRVEQIIFIAQREREVVVARRLHRGDRGDHHQPEVGARPGRIAHIEGDIPTVENRLEHEVEPAVGIAQDEIAGGGGAAPAELLEVDAALEGGRLRYHAAVAPIGWRVLRLRGVARIGDADRRFRHYAGGKDRRVGTDCPETGYAVGDRGGAWRDRGEVQVLHQHRRSANARVERDALDLRAGQVAEDD